MDPVTAPPEAAPAVADASPSFADAYAELMGDISHVPDAEPDQPAGEPPAASPDQAQPDAEPTSAAAPTTEPPATDDDPWKDSANVKYRVNGEEREFDGIKVFPDKSGFIDPDKMDLVQHRLSERDHLFETSQQRHRELEALQADHARATQWTTDDGKTVTGWQGAQAKDLAYATHRAESESYLNFINELVANPMAYLLLDEAKGTYILNPTEVRAFQAELNNKKLQLSSAVKEYYATNRPAVAASAPASAPPDPTAVADHLIKVTGVKGFGDGDKAYVAKLAKTYVRSATKDDVAKNPSLRVGEAFAPPELMELIQDRAELLARSTKQVEAASTVDKENKARIAAASRGKQPQPRPAVREQPAAVSREDAFAAEYERRQDAMAGLMRATPQ